MAGSPSINTLYIKNLDGKLNKQELRKSLYSYFSAYGQVLDVVALKAKGMRGQAFVVFQDHASAAAAHRDAAGKTFFGKAMMIEFARTVSKATAKDLDVDHAALNESAKRSTAAAAAGASAAAPLKRARAPEGDDEAEEEEDDDERTRGNETAASDAKRARLE
ncbi:hypothetical protein H9P43_007065 [Blastocladiella emersonii ATCC 22665]|nr:hypothetical protein H9P43_007065 [Blastocladiella emersonii ATCC 22665]